MLFNVRHSERADRIADGTSGKLDPPISSNGILQAKRTGQKIASTVSEHLGEDVKQIVLYSSPYLRCLMTSAYVRKALTERYPGVTSPIIVNNMLCETQKSCHGANPLLELVLRLDEERVTNLLCGEPVDSEQQWDMGEPKFPEIRNKDEVARVQTAFSQIVSKHFSADGTVVVCVSHAFSLVAFAELFEFQDYDGSRTISCISACRMLSPKTAKMILCSDTSHVSDLLQDYLAHLQKKEARKAAASLKEVAEESKQSD